MTRKRGSWWLEPQHAKARCTVKTSYDGHRCKNMARGKYGLCPVHARLSRGPAALDVSLWSRGKLEAAVVELQRVAARLRRSRLF